MDSPVTYSILIVFDWHISPLFLQCCHLCSCHETASSTRNSLCCHASVTHSTRQNPLCLRTPPSLTPFNSSQRTPFPSPRTPRPTATPARPTAAQAVQPPSPVLHPARTQAALFRCQVKIFSGFFLSVLFTHQNCIYLIKNATK